jgi:pimeloyl-ACP methyl ester carboxylesterase
LNVVLTVLPFHGARRPAGRFAGDLFPSSDVRRTNEAFGQAVTDVRSVMRWLRREGLGDRLGLMGFSLGGYVSALVASLEDSLDFVVPVVAPVALADLVWDQTVAMVGEAAVREAGFDLELFRKSLAVHCPLSHRLRVPAGRVLLVGGRADRVVPPQHVQALWEHWGRPALTWFPGGHYVHFGRQAYLRRACTLMAGARPEAATPRAALPWLRWFTPLWR